MNLAFHPQFIFRTPTLPFTGNKETEVTIKEIAHDNFFQEAIYIASPVLHNEMKKWLNRNLKEEKEIRKLVYSLHKYLLDKILKIKEEVNLNVDVFQLISSYSHMSMNRIFKSKQRTYELVIYDMLQRFFKSQSARNKGLSTVNMVLSLTAIKLTK